MALISSDWGKSGDQPAAVRQPRPSGGGVRWQGFRQRRGTLVCLRTPTHIDTLAAVDDTDSKDTRTQRRISRDCTHRWPHTRQTTKTTRTQECRRTNGAVLAEPSSCSRCQARLSARRPQTHTEGCLQTHPEGGVAPAKRTRSLAPVRTMSKPFDPFDLGEPELGPDCVLGTAASRQRCTSSMNSGRSTNPVRPCARLKR